MESRESEYPIHIPFKQLRTPSSPLLSSTGADVVVGCSSSSWPPPLRALLPHSSSPGFSWKREDYHEASFGGANGGGGISPDLTVSGGGGGGGEGAREEGREENLRGTKCFHFVQEIGISERGPKGGNRGDMYHRPHSSRQQYCTVEGCVRYSSQKKVGGEGGICSVSFGGGRRRS